MNQIQFDINSQIIQVKDITKKEEIVPSEWVGRFAAIILNTQKLQKEMEIIMGELIEKEAIFL